MTVSVDPVEFLLKLILNTHGTKVRFSVEDLYSFAQKNFQFSSAECDLLIQQLQEKKFLVLKERQKKQSWKVSLKAIIHLHDLPYKVNSSTLASLCELRGDLLSLETAIEYYREAGGNATSGGEGLASLKSVERLENLISLKKNNN